MGKKIHENPKPKEYVFSDLPDLPYDMEKHVGTSAPFQHKRHKHQEKCPGVVKSLTVS